MAFKSLAAVSKFSATVLHISPELYKCLAALSLRDHPSFSLCESGPTAAGPDTDRQTLPSSVRMGEQQQSA